MKKLNTLAIVYAHPESHGPQLCAIHMIAKYSSQVDLVFRNVAETKWKFPDNVKLIKDGKLVDQDMVYKKNKVVKVMYFIRFLYKVFANLFKKKYDLVVFFDPMAFLTFKYVKNVLPSNTFVWYHNYDVIYPENVKKYSLAHLAIKVPEKMFPRVDLFSIPMEERVKYFPVHLLKSSYQIIPNYSLLEIHPANKRIIESNKIVLIFVGSIGEGHGLEEIIKILNKNISGKELELIVKGYIREEYKNRLIRMASENAVEEKLTIIAKGPWGEVPETLRTAHIGIAIYNSKDQMITTLGKGGSGKVFQYVAEGLPVIMNTGFYQIFKAYDWAVPADLQEESLVNSISNIIKDYDKLSESAVKSFKEELNCNIYFDPLLEKITAIKNSENKK